MTLGLLALMASAVGADGGLFPVSDQPVPRFRIKYHHVTVDIDGPAATTTIDQVFVNETNQRLPASYLFPLPPGAVIDQFRVEMDGKVKPAALRQKAEARATYEEIVRKQRDPGLLTYVEQDLYRVDVFPLGPREEKRIRTSYTELLRADSHTYQYHYLLSTEKFSSRPLESVSVTVKIKTPTPLTNLYSPSHAVDVKRTSPTTAEVVWADENVTPREDFQLFYSVSPDPIGLTLLTHHADDEDGYFLLLAAPQLDVVEEEIHKDVVFVLDRSGSMRGEKIQQARDALVFCLDQLHEGDRFDLVVFNHEVQTFSSELEPAARAKVREAREFVRGIQAGGNTNIEAALQKALAYPLEGERPRYVIFLTDGLPTAGDTDVNSLLSKVRRWNEDARLFVFGAGYDVNTHFLDQLAAENRGLPEYVQPHESIELKITSLYNKISTPVLTDLALRIAGVTTSDLYPSMLPDLFAGSQLAVVGRYRGSGVGTVTLHGRARGAVREFSLRTRFPDYEPDHDFLPRLWAARRVAHLTDEAILHGRTEAVTEEIIRLSRAHGVITEMTAFLVKEDQYQTVSQLRQRMQSDLARVQAQAVGQAAVQNRANVGLKMGQMQAQANVYLDAEGREQVVQEVQNVRRKTFVQQGTEWIDTAVSEARGTLDVQAFSPAYFQLSREVPEANQYLALGENVTFTLRGQRVRVGPEGKTELTAKELAGLK